LIALNDAPLQIILTTTTHPRNIPDGWTLIETGKDSL